MDAKPTFILVQAGKRYDNRFEIEGTLSFSKSRYLHIQTDLWFTQFEEQDSVSDTHPMKIPSEHSDDLLRQYSDLVTIENQRGQYFVAATHRMIQSRRMRSTELHYLDHPLFGVIVRVNRYEPELQTKELP